MRSADFVVVGGGVTGACAAYHLAVRGADVLLVERQEIAPDVPSSSSGEHAKAFRTVYGRDRAMTRLCVESFEHWRRFEAEAGTELFVPSGMLVFGADEERTLARWPRPHHARFAIDSAAVLSEEGLCHDLLGKDALLERFPQLAGNDSYDHAILDRTAGFFHARKAVRAIAELARRAGAELWEHAPVEEVVASGDRVERLVTSRGDVAPRRAVVFAAGYMNPALVPSLRPKTRVTEQQVLFIRPEAPAAYAPAEFPIVVDINRWRYVFPVHGPGVMKVCDDDNALAEKAVDPRQPPSAVSDAFRKDASAFLEAFVPGLVGSEEIGSTTCRYTNTVREGYLVYRQGNAVVLSACSGHGFKNAPMTALMAATLADERSAPPSLLATDQGLEQADDF